MNTKIIILGGFLGSGKTTILLELAQAICKKSHKPTPVALLENEVGEIDVDSVLVGSQGYALKSIFSGCICCELTGELRVAAESIINQYDPEVLIVEASGVADPLPISQTLESLSDDVSICALLDASRWERIHNALYNILTLPLLYADVVLINKSDLVESSLVDEIKLWVREVNEHSAAIPVSAKTGIPIDVVDAILS